MADKSERSIRGRGDRVEPHGESQYRPRSRQGSPAHSFPGKRKLRMDRTWRVTRAVEDGKSICCRRVRSVSTSQNNCVLSSIPMKRRAVVILYRHIDCQATRNNCRHTGIKEGLSGSAKGNLGSFGARSRGVALPRETGSRLAEGHPKGMALARAHVAPTLAEGLSARLLGRQA
jgi:hypothetical protein